MFATISEHAQNIPVLIIATKKDEFEGIKEREARTMFKKEGRKVTFEDLEEYAAAQLQLRMQQIEEEIAGVEGGRFDACIAVAKGKQVQESQEASRRLGAFTDRQEH